MLFQSPELEDIDLAVLGLISTQRDRLKIFTQNTPRRWIGSLRRSTFAKAIRASNSIEGIHASLENVIAAVEADDPDSIEKETWAAITGYRNAMTYVMQAASDPDFEFSKQFIKSLQFMMTSYDMSKNPGQWRPGSVFVVNEATGQKVYEGPEPERVDGLVTELVASLKSSRNEPAIVRAAMAHLNLTMIHPFKDGNGRVARALQTLVLAQEGVLAPIFSSIEEWLGRVTQEYYAVLAEVGQGKWNPQHSALPWIRFCLTAHFHQAATLLRRNQEYEELFEGIEKIIRRENLPERCGIPMFDAAQGYRLTNAWYRRDAEVNELTASRDMKKLTELTIFEAEGEKRGRVYRAGKELLGLRQSVRRDKEAYADPYELLKDQETRGLLAPDEPRLPGL
jgi:Fic family protein